MTKSPKAIDGIDRDILRVMNSSNRSLAANEIAKHIGITPASVGARLKKLWRKRIVRPERQGGMRTYARTFSGKIKTIKARSYIGWVIDVK